MLFLPSTVCLKIHTTLIIGRINLVFSAEKAIPHRFTKTQSNCVKSDWRARFGLEGWGAWREAGLPRGRDPPCRRPVLAHAQPIFREKRLRFRLEWARVHCSWDARGAGRIRWRSAAFPRPNAGWRSAFCGSKRPAGATAAHRVDLVIPPVPAGRWVISVPSRLR